MPTAKKDRPAACVQGRFAELRAKCLSTRAEFESYKSQLQAKYGFQNRSWLFSLNRTEERKYDSLQNRVSKADDKMMVLLDKISPRNWHEGVPAHWVFTELTYEDAVRPLNQPLSVTPPLSWGAREPMR